MSNLVLSCEFKWFAVNSLVLNEYNEIHNKEVITFYITYCYNQKYIGETNNSKFLHSEIDKHTM